MVRTSQKTLYATDLNLHMLAGIDYKPLANTTLNEKFAVNADASAPSGQYPKLNYFCLGIGGESPIQGDGAYISSEHSPIDAALFQHIPFIIRTVNSDLSVSERANYRMRVLTTLAGVQYACYYLKVIPSFDVPDYFNTINTITPKDETKLQYSTISILDTNIPELLSPTPRSRNIDINKIDTTTKVTKVGKITLELNTTDIKEIRNAMTILGYTASSVREIGLVSGHDISTDYGREVIHAQILFHIGTEMALTIDMNTKSTIKRIVELGGEEPLVR